MELEADLRNHMEVHWMEYTADDADIPITEAGLIEKSAIIGRCGLELLSCGIGAWRVRSSMNALSRALGVTCTVDIGLLSLTYNCFDGEECVSQSLCLTNTGVNTSKLNRLEHFVTDFPTKGIHKTGAELHTELDDIEHIHGLYSPAKLGLAAALACGGFTFLLGGGLPEMLLAFCGAGIGNAVRCKLIKHRYTLFMNVALSVAAACLTYTILLRLAQFLFGLSAIHEAGYICAMLFIIPGFPFITSGIDLAKLDLRSGLERLSYALIIILVATLSAWIMALLFHLCPLDFEPLGLNAGELIVCRLLASFCGVFGFSIMFNSPLPLAVTAACIGAVANTFRLELVDFAAIPPAAAAFCGAALSGLLASFLKTRVGYPRIALTVPAIVIMVPGLYFYKGIYNLGIMALGESASWLASAILIIMALPLGLIFARILSDKSFRYCT